MVMVVVMVVELLVCHPPSFGPRLGREDPMAEHPKRHRRRRRPQSHLFYDHRTVRLGIVH